MAALIDRRRQSESQEHMSEVINPKTGKVIYLVATFNPTRERDGRGKQVVFKAARPLAHFELFA